MGNQLFDSGYQFLFKFYFDEKISLNFITCADKQLTHFFYLKTGIEKARTPKLRLGWYHEDGFHYKRDEVSTLKSKLWFGHGFIPVTICWKSHSGRIYELKDEDIDCADLEFWFAEELDPAYCKHLVSPKWSLYTFKEFDADQFRTNVVEVSVPFLYCADKQLSAYFEKHTGIKIDKNVALEKNWYRYTKGVKSEVETGLGTVSYFHKVKYSWYSHSGRIYLPTDTDINCDDIVFEMSGLNPSEYVKWLFPDTKLPFKLKDLSYELEVLRFSMDCEIILECNESDTNAIEQAVQRINNFIGDFNLASEKRDRKFGVVHNWNWMFKDNGVTYEIDMGSTGSKFLKELLKEFSSIGIFKKVTIR